MAGEWIKWTKGLARKPEVLAVASRLGMSRHAAAGLLMEVWEWADDNASVRKMSGSEPDTCPGAVLIGDNAASIFDATFGVPGLAETLCSVGWLVQNGGTLEFPNFTRHNGKSSKARALDAMRKSKSRSSVSGKCPDANRTKTGPEKKREEKSINTPQSPPRTGGTGDTTPIPASLDTAQFRAAWDEWIAYRKERGLAAYKPRGLKALFGSLAKFGPVTAAAAIAESMAQNWQGLFPERIANGGTRPGGSVRPVHRVEYDPSRGSKTPILCGVEDTTEAAPGVPPELVPRDSLC